MKISTWHGFWQAVRAALANTTHLPKAQIYKFPSSSRETIIAYQSAGEFTPILANNALIISSSQIDTRQNQWPPSCAEWVCVYTLCADEKNRHQRWHTHTIMRVREREQRDPYRASEFGGWLLSAAKCTQQRTCAMLFDHVSRDISEWSTGVWEWPLSNIILAAIIVLHPTKNLLPRAPFAVPRIIIMHAAKCISSVQHIHIVLLCAKQVTRIPRNKKITTRFSTKRSHAAIDRHRAPGKWECTLNCAQGSLAAEVPPNGRHHLYAAWNYSNEEPPRRARYLHLSALNAIRVGLVYLDKVIID